jgi:hypothetical protein
MSNNVKAILVTVFVFALVAALYSWLQISPLIYNDFKGQCDSNGGVSCMGFYWKQKDYFTLVLKFSVGLMVASGLGMISPNNKN